MPRFAERTLREWNAITQRRKIEKLRDLQRDILEKIVSGKPTIDILNALCTQVETMVPEAICSLMIFEASTSSLRVLAAPSAPETLRTALDGLMPGEQAGSCGTVVHTGEPVFVTDTEVDTRWAPFREMATQFGIRACWSMPISSKKKKILGTFAISHSHPCSPTSFDRQLLDIASSMAGITIQQREAEDTLRASEQAVRELYDITSSRGMTFDQRVQALLELGCHRFHLPIGLLTCLQEDCLVVVAAFGSDHEFPIGTSVPPSYTLCQQVLDAGEPIAYENVDESLWQAHPVAATKNIRVYLGTPVLVGGRFYGTFCFLNTTAHTTPFTKADKDFLQLMAQWLGNELERREDEESLRELNLALSKAMPAISRVDKEGRFVHMNATYAEILGYEPSELIGQSWKSTIYPEDLPIPYAAYETMLQHGQSEFQSRAVRKDGSVFYKHVMLVNETDQHGISCGASRLHA